MNYAIQLPGTILFGSGSVNRLPELPPPNSRVLLVTGRSAARNGLAARLQGLIHRADTLHFASVPPEPTLDAVDELRRFIRLNRIDALVAAGGGSVIDTAKTAAALAASELPTAEYFYRRAAITRPGLWLAALPTTAGTGAEITPNCVFTDPATGVKQSIRSFAMLPAVALVDPELTISCPAAITAASGMDALTQAIESYLGRGANHATRPGAAQAAKLIFGALAHAYGNLEDVASREDVAEGTLLGAIAFSTSGLGAVHGLAHPLGARYHIPHGAVCGILLPTILEWNQGAASDELAVACGFADTQAMVAKIRALLAEFGLGPTLTAYGLKRADFAWILANSRSGSMKNNPRALSDEDLTQILEAML